MPPSEARPEWADMQGLVASGYPHLDLATYHLFRITDPARARAWLRSVLPHITPALRKPRGGYASRDAARDVNVNVALTWSGLRTLCEEPEGASAAFPEPFVEGIDGAERRRRILGDLDGNHSSRWRWGGKDRPVDLLLMIFAAAPGPVSCLPADGLAPVGAPLVGAPLSLMQGREHFGFLDGLSQPILTGTRDADRYPESRHLTELGEIVLGYRNADGVCAALPPFAAYDEFGRNGTFLVLRQLEQHVTEFWDFVSGEARRGRPPGASPDEAALAAELLAAKIVGRARDGTPLVPYTSRDDNEFGFADDPYGYGCPMGAHIRRANPRDTFLDPNAPLRCARAANRHRVVRRGRAYGLPESRARGLLFLCLNADLERQFEFVQGDWINDPGFSGVAGERDPLIGRRKDDNRFTVQGLPAAARVTDLPHFVTVRGGEYFFLPGRRALAHVATEPAARPIRRTPPPPPAPAASAGGVDRVIALLEDKLRRTQAPPQIRRDAHPKMNGCVQAEFIVDDTVPEDLREGVFARPGVYKAWVRFSNAIGGQHDLADEPRGLAIKLLGVTGERVASDPPGSDDGERGTQDFLLVTHDAFFLPDSREYDRFVQAFEDSRKALFWFFLSRPRLWRGGIALVRSGRVLARSPLAISYFSQTPYQLGSRAQVKLRATPVMTEALERSLPGALGFRAKRAAAFAIKILQALPGAGWLASLAGIAVTDASATEFCDRHLASRDLLRHAAMSFLAGHEAQFRLQVQLYVSRRLTPIDDATRRWRTWWAPFRTVATLRIPRQVFWPEAGMPADVRRATETLMDLGEHMSFTPWHTLVAHTPLGDINQARRRIYPAIARFRRTRNLVLPGRILALQGPASYDRLRDRVQGGRVAGAGGRWPGEEAP